MYISEQHWTRLVAASPSLIELTTPKRTAQEHAGAHPLTAYPNWNVLGWLWLFRFLIGAGLAVVFLLTEAYEGGERVSGGLVWHLLTVYALLLIAGLIGLRRRWPAPEHYLQLTIFGDLAVFALLMHAAGGIATGFGLLLAIVVATGALLMEGRQSLLFASLATLAVIAEEGYSQLYLEDGSSHLTQAGLLGLTYFSVALLSHVLYRRVRAAELLAAQRKVDIADLSKLNEYIIQSLAIGVIAVDGERLVRVQNVAARQLIGQTDGQLGSHLAEVSPALARWLDLAASAKGQREPPGTLIIGNRELRPTLQWLGEYRASGVLIFLEDQQEITKQAQQIKLASLGTLTASIAHNIRNPLSAISHAAQLLSESDGLSEDDRHLLTIMHRNGGRIEEIIQSILQLSRRRQPEPTEIDLVPWLIELCDDFCHSRGFREDAIRFQTENTQLPVVSDPRHLSQILINLCENAVKHGVRGDEPPTLELRTQRVPGAILVDVLDEGPGIPPDKLEEVFNPFFTTSSSGTGLGLYIARELAETNGLLLEYIARQPQGSCFRLIFPT